MFFKKVFFTVLTAAMLSQNLAALASGETGGGSSGGGNSLAAHFAAVGGRIGKRFQIVCAAKEAPEAVCSHLAAFLGALTDKEKAVVPRTEVLGPDSRPREAINNFKDEIQLNVTMWEKLTDDLATAERQVSIVAHEFSGIARIEKSDNYAFSSALMQVFKDVGFDFAAIAGKPKAPGLGAVVPSTNTSRIFDASKFKIENKRIGASSAEAACHRMGYKKMLRVWKSEELPKDAFGRIPTRSVVALTSQGMIENESGVETQMIEKLECDDPIAVGKVYCDPTEGVLFPSQIKKGQPFNNMGYQYVARTENMAVISYPSMKTNNGGWFSSGYTPLGSEYRSGQSYRNYGEAICRRFGYRDILSMETDYERASDKMIHIDPGYVAVRFDLYKIERITCANVCGN